MVYLMGINWFIILMEEAILAAIVSATNDQITQRG
jgi:hypothetical protein